MKGLEHSGYWNVENRILHVEKQNTRNGSSELLPPFRSHSDHLLGDGLKSVMTGHRESVWSCYYTNLDENHHLCHQYSVVPTERIRNSASPTLLLAKTLCHPVWAFYAQCS